MAASSLEKARIVTGMLGGLAATAPMTAAMKLLHGTLPLGQGYAVPPVRLAARLFNSFRPFWRRRKPPTGLPMAAHFFYGAAMGGLFGAFTRRRRTSLWDGVLYGLMVWAGSYKGWMPLFERTRPVSREPWKRQGMMIVSHVIWGLILGAFLRPVSNARVRASLTRDLWG